MRLEFGKSWLSSTRMKKNKLLTSLFICKIFVNFIFVQIFLIDKIKSIKSPKQKSTQKYTWCIERRQKVIQSGEWDNKTTPSPYLRALLINANHHRHWMITYIHSNPSQETIYKEMFDCLIYFFSFFKSSLIPLLPKYIK